MKYIANVKFISHQFATRISALLYKLRISISTKHVLLINTVCYECESVEICVSIIRLMSQYYKINEE